MKKNLLKLLFLLMMLAQNNSFAGSGDKGGNGGNTLVCFSDASVASDVRMNNLVIEDRHMKFVGQVIPLDLFEARVKVSQPQFSGPMVVYTDDYLVLPQMSESADDYVQRIANRFDFLPELSSAIKEKHSLLKKRVHANEPIDRIDDVGETYLEEDKLKPRDERINARIKQEMFADPKHCVITTLIKQSMIEGEVVLKFDDRLFGFDQGLIAKEVIQGVLMLHETVLRWSLDVGHKDARNAREMTALLMQKHVTRNELLKQLKIRSFI